MIDAHNRSILVVLAVWCAVSCVHCEDIVAQGPWTDNHLATSLHEVEAKDITGRDVELSKYKGKVLLVSNVASNCGYTENHYEGFKKLMEMFPRELMVVAFPCNQFGEQEPGENLAIKAFADGKGFKGEVMDKVYVNGDNMHPVFKFLKEGSRRTQPLEWNFIKFLVRKDGTVFGRFPHTDDPMTLAPYIKRLINDEL